MIKFTEGNEGNEGRTLRGRRAEGRGRRTAALLCALVLMTLSSWGQTPVMFPMRDMTGNDQVRAITITSLDGPVSYNGIIYYSAPVTVIPVANGATNSLGQSCTGIITNLVGGNLRITFQGLPKAMQIYVPFGSTNLVSAADPAVQRFGIVQVYTVTFATNMNATPVVNVTAAPWLADPRGRLDATAALQLALNYAANLLNGGISPIVQLPAGWLRITNQITIPPLHFLGPIGLQAATAPNNTVKILGMGPDTLVDATAIPNGKSAFFAMSGPTNNPAGWWNMEVGKFTLIGSNVVVTPNPTNAIPYTQLAISTNVHTVGFSLGGLGEGFYDTNGVTQPIHNLYMHDMDVWGFEVNVGLTNTTQTVLERCRFHGGSYADLIANADDQLKIDSCSFGYNTYSANGVFQGNNYLASLAIMGGLGQTILNIEVSQTPRLGFFEHTVALIGGMNAEAPTGPHMFLLTNAFTNVKFQSCVVNNWPGVTTNNVVFQGWNGGLDFLTVENLSQGIGARVCVETDTAADIYHVLPTFTGYNFLPEITYEWRLNYGTPSTNYIHVPIPQQEFLAGNQLLVQPHATANGMFFDTSLSGGHILNLGFPDSQQALRVSGATWGLGPALQLFGPSYTWDGGASQGNAYLDTDPAIGDIYLRPGGQTVVQVRSNYVQVTKPVYANLSGSTNLPPAGLQQAGATPSQVLAWNGTAWVPQNPGGGGVGGTNATFFLTSAGYFNVYATNGTPLLTVSNGVITLLTNVIIYGTLTINAPTNFDYVSNLVATGFIVASNGFYGDGTHITGIVDTNTVNPIQTFASVSNAVPLNNGEWLLVSAGPCSLTNVSGAVAGYRTWSLLTVSNSSGGTFTNFCTIPNARYIGAATTNALAIPAGKVAQWLVEAWGTGMINVFNCVSQ